MSSSEISNPPFPDHYFNDLVRRIRKGIPAEEVMKFGSKAWVINQNLFDAVTEEKYFPVMISMESYISDSYKNFCQSIGVDIQEPETKEPEYTLSHEQFQEFCKAVVETSSHLMVYVEKTAMDAEFGFYKTKEG
jgi:hypothetical protein